MSDTNHNGIKSERLYTTLREILTLNDVAKGIKTTNISPADFINELSAHILHTIPHELFQLSQRENEMLFEENLSRLETLCSRLQNVFGQRGGMVVPFTILRIVELCFDPLRYFKVFELVKFVNALEKCCLVESCLKVSAEGEEEVEEEEKGEGELRDFCKDTYEVVSLEKIPWLESDDDKEDTDMKEFIKRIDGMMNLNYNLGVPDNEDEDSGGIDVDVNGSIAGYLNGDDVKIEEYYEDDIEEEEENDDDDDGSFDPEFKSKVVSGSQEKDGLNEIDDEDEDDEDYVIGSDEEEDDDNFEGEEEEGDDEQLGEADTVVRGSEDSEDALAATPRKRGTSELDESENPQTAKTQENSECGRKSGDVDESVSVTVKDVATTPKKQKVEEVSDFTAR